ncbi:MAG: chorismate synthase [bacterium]
MLRFLTAGESHGKSLTAIIEGIPAKLGLGEKDINKELTRRQSGYGRGRRMQIEKDTAEITSGVRHGKTLGSPITMIIKNRDWQNWKNIMSIEPAGKNSAQAVTHPRPGHADLAGLLKYGFSDARNIIERASARETAARVALGAVSKKLLGEFKIKVYSRTVQIGSVKCTDEFHPSPASIKLIESSKVRCLCKDSTKKMIALIDEARDKGDTLGGIFEIVVTNVPVGLGSHVDASLKLDGRLAQGLMSIQSVKGVEVGLGFEAARRFGSLVHDRILYQKGSSANKGNRFFHKTNNAGGIEGGISNGESITLRVAVKPISTLMDPLQSVDIVTKKAVKATVERSDVCVVPAAGVVGEAVVAFEIARAMKEKFGADSVDEMKTNFMNYIESVKGR